MDLHLTFNRIKVNTIENIETCVDRNSIFEVKFTPMTPRYVFVKINKKVKMKPKITCQFIIFRLTKDLYI